MTELDTITTGTDLAPAEIVQAQKLERTGIQKLREHAEMKAMALDYAQFITKTSNCPDIYRGKPNDAAAAILRGMSLGFDPDGALEAFFVIKGKTGLYARAQIAVAESVGCTVWEVEASDESVTWAGTRPGDDKVETATWTIARATKAGYTSNQKYKSNPQEMLRAKAQTELARIIAPGPLMGLISEIEVDEVTTVRTPSRRVDRPTGRDAARAALDMQPADTTPEPEPAAEGQEQATAEQLQELAALLDAHQCETREEKLEWINEQYPGRDFTSAADLTEVEAAALIHFLKEQQ